MVVRWLTKLWSRERPPTPPILLRVKEPDGDAPAVLDIESRWAPGGHRIDRSVRTADGLAVVHWLGEQDEVELTVRSTLGQTTLTVRKEESQGRTFDLRLGHLDPATVDERLQTSASGY